MSSKQRGLLTVFAEVIIGMTLGLLGGVVLLLLVLLLIGVWWS